MSDRKEGWYWVKLKGGEWTPCEWLPDEDYPDDTECWVDAPLSPIGYAGDLAFEEIGPRIPTPDEPWQCVPVELTAAMDEACEAEWLEADEWHHLYSAVLAAAPKP